MPWGASERAQDAGALLNVSEAQEAENANSGHFWTKEGRSTRPGSHSSRPKRTGFAAHDQIIADRPQKGKGASCANGALKRAGFNS